MRVNWEESICLERLVFIEYAEYLLRFRIRERKIIPEVQGD